MALLLALGLRQCRLGLVRTHTPVSDSHAHTRVRTCAQPLPRWLTVAFLQLMLMSNQREPMTAAENVPAV